MTIPALRCPCSSALSQTQVWTEVWGVGGNASQCRQNVGAGPILLGACGSVAQCSGDSSVGAAHIPSMPEAPGQCS